MGTLPLTESSQLKPLSSTSVKQLYTGLSSLPRPLVLLDLRCALCGKSRRPTLGRNKEELRLFGFENQDSYVFCSSQSQDGYVFCISESQDGYVSVARRTRTATIPVAQRIKTESGWKPRTLCRMIREPSLLEAVNFHAFELAWKCVNRGT
jgi:hypothetical protein